MKSKHITIAFLLTAVISCQEAQYSPGPSDTTLYTLSDGRNLSYEVFGTPDGSPVFYFHGFPGSRLDVHLFNGPSLAVNQNLRLIAVDRPGYGSSDPDPGRNLNDWPKDLVELADHLEIQSFSILGYSGGAPFALACAAEIPDRVREVVVVSGMGPVEAPESKKGKAMLIPKAPKLILNGMYKMVNEKPDKLESNMKKGFPEVDRVILDDSEVLVAMNKTISEGFRTGYSGGLDDATIYKTAWEFNLESIEIPVTIWHGNLDENVKIETAEYVIGQLPQCNKKIIKGEGHLSLLTNYAEEIFAQLKQ